MANLPSVNDTNWGNTLNTFLKVSLNALTGKIKSAAQREDAVQDGDDDRTVADKGYVDDSLDAKVGSGTADPLSYSGGESVTLPNGLIMKMGYATSDTVVYSEAFPNDTISVQTTKTSNNSNDSEGSVYNVSISGFTMSNAENLYFYWFAIGY